MDKSKIIEEYLSLKELLESLKKRNDFLRKKGKKQNLDEQESCQRKIDAKEIQLHEFKPDYCNKIKQQMIEQLAEYNKILYNYIKIDSTCRLAIELGSKRNLVMTIVSDIKEMLLHPGGRRVPIELRCVDDLENSIEAGSLRDFLMSEQKRINEIKDANIVKLVEYKEGLLDRIRDKYNIV